MRLVRLTLLPFREGTATIDVKICLSWEAGRKGEAGEAAAGAKVGGATAESLLVRRGATMYRPRRVRVIFKSIVMLGTSDVSSLKWT